MIKKLYTSLSLGLLAFPSNSLAQGITVGQPNQGLSGSLGSIIQRFVGIAIMFAGIAFLAMLLVGGFQYFSAAGDQAQAQKANKTMMYGAIGLFIVASSFVIARFVAGDLLNINIFG